nr:MAG TPA: hypothetical protein [Caudoviricetes sp.]
MKVRAKGWKEVDYLFPKETTWRVEVAGIPGYFWYYKEDCTQESDYYIDHSLTKREVEGKRMEREVRVLAKISSKENTLSFKVYGPKRLVTERQNEIDTAKSVISAIVLEAQP